MGFILFLAAAFFLAFGFLPYCSEEDSGPSERLCLATLLGFAILTGTNWVLSLTGLLSAKSLWFCLALYALVGAGFHFLHRRRSPGVQREPLVVKPIGVAAIVVLGAASLYILLRGFMLNVWEFDALSYHFPKAVELLRGHGIHQIPANDFRVPYFPWNYELLLADGLALTPGDSLTHLIGLLATFGFCAYAYAIFRKAWPRLSGDEALLGVMLVCATPILILQVGAYKNDVLFSFYLMAFVYWSSLWAGSSRTRDLLLAVVSLALSFGTKPTAFYLLPTALILLVRYHPRFSIKAMGGPWKAARLVVALFVICLLMGAFWPLFNKVWCGHFLGDTAVVGGVDGFQANCVPKYAGFSYLWKFPLLVFERPFSSKPDGVWAFWEHRYLWWPKYQILYSHFGWLCTCLLLFVPFAIREHRKRGDSASSFRVITTVTILTFAFLSLPQRNRIDGMFCGFPRTLLCIPVLVMLWSALPLLVWLREQGKRMIWALAAVGVLAYFFGQAFVYLKNDESKSFTDLIDTLGHPDTRREDALVTFINRNAGSTDVIAYDSGFGGFCYPLYGPNLSRPLIFLQPRSVPVLIPAEAKWVVIERGWNSGWSHPGVQSTAEFWAPWNPVLSEEDKLVFAQLLKDPAFILVFANPATKQAVFARRSTARPRAE